MIRAPSLLPRPDAEKRTSHSTRSRDFIARQRGLRQIVDQPARLVRGEGFPSDGGRSGALRPRERPEL